MKKHLLLGSALLAAISAFPQSSHVKTKPTGIVDMSEKLARKYAVINNPSENAGASKAAPNTLPAINEPAPMGAVSSVASPTVQWKSIGGSMNIFGMLVSSSKPLNYNDNVNAVSFVHRKSASYPSAPANNSGGIVVDVTTNWGATWDSTCIWSDGTNLARYPQGGIYNPAGGSNINNAYAVGMGPVTGGSGWLGMWYASKQLGTANYNYTASAVPGAQQFISNQPPYNPGLTKHDFARYSFTSTDDGKVRSIGGRYTTLTGGQPDDFQGAAIIKGTFAAGAFTWTSDTIIPNAIVKTDGKKQMWSQPLMAWNEAGTVGYAVVIGAAATATGSNKGWQPMVYKTTNSGLSWASIPGIDFNDPAFAPIKAHIATVNTNTALEVPFFNVGEGYDCIVDANDKLHIVSTIVGTSSTHNDTLAYTYQFGTEKYAWNHTPGERPYIYDFIGDGTGPWTFLTVDSMSTEGPGSGTTDGGYADNPWDADPGNSNSKVTSDSRTQVARTVAGDYLVYSWAESDTNFTNSQKKWNSLPNIKARCLATPQGTMATTMSPTEINVTKPTPAAVPVTYTSNPNVANRAMFHYQSRTGLFVTCLGTNTITIKMPFTVTNSNPYAQLGNNNHWYSSATLDFGGLTTCTGFQQSLAYNVNSIEIFPNPASSNATIAVDLKEEGMVSVNVYNTVGQLVKSSNAKGNMGENKINMSLDNLNTGIYVVKVQVGNTTSTKKLIVQ